MAKFQFQVKYHFCSFLRKHLQVGDTIIYRNEAQDDCLGKIEQIKEDNLVLTAFYYPHQTGSGKESHHGKKELFKTNQVVTCPLSSAVKKCDIVDLKEFIHLSLDGKKSKDLFVVRYSLKFQSRH